MTSRERIDAIRARAMLEPREPEPVPLPSPTNKAAFIREWLQRDPNAISSDIAKAWAEHSDRAIVPQEVTQARRKLGLDAPPPPQNEKAERNREITRLHNDGYSWRQLADRFGLSHTRCQQIVRAVTRAEDSQ